MSEHITTEEMLNFILAEDKVDDNLKLINKVNNHIIKCDECLNKLKAFLILKDGLDDEKLLEQIKQTAKSNLEQVDVLKECKKSDL